MDNTEKREGVALNDDSLDAVAGGITVSETIKKIEELWAFVPRDILDKVISTLKNQGPKAAKALIKRIVKNYPLIGPMADLIPD